MPLDMDAASSAAAVATKESDRSYRKLDHDSHEGAVRIVVK